jgi:hypothetical protein
MAEVRGIVPAVAAGSVRNLASVVSPDVGLSVFRDPATRKLLLLAVHHGDGTVTTRISLRRWLWKKKVTSNGSRAVIARGGLKTTLGPYQAQVYVLN